jgi:hypothetical protein
MCIHLATLAAAAAAEVMQFGRKVMSWGEGGTGNGRGKRGREEKKLAFAVSC